MRLVYSRQGLPEQQPPQTGRLSGREHRRPAPVAASALASGAASGGALIAPVPGFRTTTRATRLRSLACQAVSHAPLTTGLHHVPSPTSKFGPYHHCRERPCSVPGTQPEVERRAAGGCQDRLMGPGVSASHHGCEVHSYCRGRDRRHPFHSIVGESLRNARRKMQSTVHPSSSPLNTCRGSLYDFRRCWQRDGTRHRPFSELQTRAPASAPFTRVSINRTILRAHQHAAGARKRGAKRNRRAASPPGYHAAVVTVPRLSPRADARLSGRRAAPDA